ncbi:hypothetical protein VpasPP24_32 [Vibrio phage Vpas_PP24]|nr:hypothetical protein VpasPP24_32 [Vibrio phage Vpas_PP24]
MDYVIKALILLVLLFAVWYLGGLIVDNANQHEVTNLKNQKREYLAKLSKLERDAHECYKDARYRDRAIKCKKAINKGDFTLADYYLKRLNNMNLGKTY